MKLRTLKQWIVYTFMRDLHDGHAQLHRAKHDVEMSLLRSRMHVQDLQKERADLTEILVSLVAKDDAREWTTVFDADTRLPDSYQDQLNILVNRA